MVKADAYGLGMAAIVEALRSSLDASELWGFGVATVAEGETLRGTGWEGRILVFSPVLPGEEARAARAELTLCISDLEALRRWRAAARAVGKPLALHTEVDTGMGRAGFAWDAATEWGAEVAESAGTDLRWEGCYTHFHSADDPELVATDLQWERFRRALQALPPDPAGARIVHVANSAASLRCAGYGCPVVRPGIVLYGGCVGASMEPSPMVAVRARLALIRDVPAGSTLGYGATYVSRRPERWGTVAIGYGDGIPRVLGRRGGGMLIRGHRVPIIGRISMDVTTVDLTDQPDAAVGDTATLIGRDGEQEITLDQVARQCGTISYEILTGLTPRLPRIYMADGDSA